MTKYPKFREMPYHTTTVDPEDTKAEINKLLRKYDIKSKQWTELDSMGEQIKFIFETEVQGKLIKVAVKFDIPEIKCLIRNKVALVPKKVVYRMFYYSLKSLLETTKYGILKKEDLFFSYIVTQLPDGKETTMKELYLNQALLLGE